MTNKYIIVGDIHGCLDELLMLLHRYGRGRKLISVGDMVDKGPKSHRVAEFVMLTGRSVLGNHEENHRRYHRHEINKAHSGVANPMNKGSNFLATRKKLLSSHLPILAWFKQLPPYIEIPEYNTVVLHGGLLPGHTHKTMPADKICRVREVKDNGKMAQLHEAAGATHWPEVRDDANKPFIVYGHDPYPDIREVNNTLCVDTGCVYGNRLSAYLLPERDIVSIRAQKVYQRHSSKHDWVNLQNKDVTSD